MRKFIFIGLVLSFISATKAYPGIDESGPGNGTDYVKVLFAEAHYRLLSSVARINDAEIQSFDLDLAMKSWLLAKSENGSSRWQNLKSYLRSMDLHFQQEPCTDFSQKPASICFFNNDPLNPSVLISLKENKMTTTDQAMAMLIHEAGHFVGQTDHLFLDKLGVRLVADLQLPSLIISDEESVETVAAPFVAKKTCDEGTSDQAQLLKRNLLQAIMIQCGQKRIKCDTEKVQFVFSGTANFKGGVGYDMTVTCRARAVLTLR